MTAIGNGSASTSLSLLNGKIKNNTVNTPATGVNHSITSLVSGTNAPAVLQINNNIRNQFELPVLFYVLAIAFWALDAVNVLVLVAAWLFVASRIAHAWVHLTSNYIPNRRRLFTVGWWVLAAMVLLAIYALIDRN